MRDELLNFVNAQEKDTALLRKFYEKFEAYEHALQCIDTASRQAGSPPPGDLATVAHRGVLAMRDTLNEIDIETEGDKWWLVLQGSRGPLPHTVRVQIPVGGDFVLEMVKQWKRKRDKYKW